MSERKYRLTDETITVFGRTLYRIQATENIPSRYVDKGDLGGFIEKESNLFGDAWVFGDARRCSATRGCPATRRCIKSSTFLLLALQE